MDNKHKKICKRVCLSLSNRICIDTVPDFYPRLIFQLSRTSRVRTFPFEKIFKVVLRLDDVMLT
jgi:hypothetical protein